MNKKTKAKLKREFLKKLQSFAKELHSYVSTQDNQWVIKGFIDVFKNIYTITGDTKIVSKVIEI
ncbi:restriction endonuclease, partial [bacterium]|nr:restriction endonuclease [bacterium]